MSVSVSRLTRPLISLATLPLCVAMAACRQPPNEEDGRRRLTGTYTYFDRRGPSEINSNFKSSSLELRADGAASQICQFKDGKRYQSSGATWSYNGIGNVSIDPLKDCSWVDPLERGAPLRSQSEVPP
jgi:hypothetical protein